MEFHLWLSLVAICIMGALSPGPSLALVVKNSLHGGHSQGYATAISHGFGVALYAGFTVTGIGLIIVNSPVLYGIIQYTGAAFLVYLGIKALMSKKTDVKLGELSSENKQKINGWRDGFLIAFLNPKLAIFFLALFSQFVTVEASVEQNMIMVATVGLIDAIWYCIVTYALTRGPVLKRLQNNNHIVDRIMGSFLLLLAARVVIN